jgi:hypothetical protein
MTHIDFIMNEPVAAMSDEDLAASISGVEICRKMLATFPDGTQLWDAALCGNARRDPSAIEFMRTFEAAA